MKRPWRYHKHIFTSIDHTKPDDDKIDIIYPSDGKPLTSIRLGLQQGRRKRVAGRAIL